MWLDGEKVTAVTVDQRLRRKDSADSGRLDAELVEGEGTRRMESDIGGSANFQNFTSLSNRLTAIYTVYQSHFN